MYVLSYAGGANLLRHAEGATWLAIVSVSENLKHHFYLYLGAQFWNRCIRAHFGC